MRRLSLSVVVAALLLAGATPASPLAPSPASAHSGCAATDRDGRGERLVGLAREVKRELGLNSVLFRVTIRGKEVVTAALGHSMTGVPADTRMHFRNGGVAISYLTHTLLQLVQEGRVGLDDPIARWFPKLPHGDKITLRMLGSTTSGLADYATDPAFLEALHDDPFRQWTRRELVAISTAEPLWYEPGANWSYSHANFQLLGRALEKITGTDLATLLRKRVLRPFGLRETRSDTTPAIPGPVLHAFTSERGPYEESTYWNPSWSIARGAVMTTDICDLARSAEAIGSGELLSPASYRTMLDPGTVGLGGPTDRCPETVCRAQTEERHYGLGNVILNSWVVQNPLFNGFAAQQSYLPSRGIAIAVATTVGPDSPTGNTASTVARRLAEVLAPDQPLG
ncbi:serine hydrolase domain-containing protein [Streptomyces sp. MUM 178J]|uniref:serine hydrolase domain-containing protein n=1 Tax=Streptomyces sp. MUM 178J TaxID=2791991 RepID=UPI001F0356C1|nr:serine hydrolase domain-containing protein [Streptomyces sp. MUM 178J]WRQ81765.1 serine hydrolase domain-containing protein [Streptomyces sp. MUM 178J]